LARQYAWLRADKLSVIYNFLPASRASEPETFGFLSDDVRYIVGMGRLEPEKGFDRLIRAFHRVEKDCPGWKLIIVGEGSLRAELTQLIASLGLTGRIELPGRVNSPCTLFRRCDLFCLSSESEGFGLVLVEAMSAGLAVISFDCDFGPREIITPGVSGILVPAGNIPALSRAIASLVKNDERRARLAQQGLESVGRFAPDEILNRWEALFRSLTDQRIALQDVHPPTPATGRS
jgi:GalNAc-alpha-(1->4)-GalNAc-alpha-(1->3)-diNAcBac-PP-undecaprenol alpha-1,4-N-acetyl-D-galactosaminyltransferase